MIAPPPQSYAAVHFDYEQTWNTASMAPTLPTSPMALMDIPRAPVAPMSGKGMPHGFLDFSGLYGKGFGEKGFGEKGFGEKSSGKGCLQPTYDSVPNEEKVKVERIVAFTISQAP